MKVIVRLFDNDRNNWTIQGSAIISHLKSVPHIRKWAKQWVINNANFYKLNSSKYRLEFFYSNLYQDNPDRIIEGTI